MVEKLGWFTTLMSKWIITYIYKHVTTCYNPNDIWTNPTYSTYGTGVHYITLTYIQDEPQSIAPIYWSGHFTGWWFGTWLL
jgi:hypothetical protein